MCTHARRCGRSAAWLARFSLPLPTGARRAPILRARRVLPPAACGRYPDECGCPWPDTVCSWPLLAAWRRPMPVLVRCPCRHRQPRPPPRAAAVSDALAQDPGQAEGFNPHEDRLTAEEDLVQAQAD